MLAAVQAALLDHDARLATAWLGGGTPGEEREGDHALALELARALIDRAAGEHAAAIRRVEQATARVGHPAAPELELRAGVLQAMLLLDTRQYAAASAILGELEKYAESDYRVAWVLSALYEALGDARTATAARERASALAGERDMGLTPIL